MPPSIVRDACWPPRAPDARSMLAREWLATNGLGGFASGTVLGVPTRRYHGLLIAALPAPLGRVLMLTGLEEELEIEDVGAVRIGGRCDSSTLLRLPGPDLAIGFRLELGLPVWRYESGGLALEKRLFLPQGANSVQVLYRVLAGKGRLHLAPAVHFQQVKDPPVPDLGAPYGMEAAGDGYEIRGGPALPPLQIGLCGWHGGAAASFALSADGAAHDIFLMTERQRGLPARDRLWSPGRFTVELAEGDAIAFTASVEEWRELRRCDPWTEHRREVERRQALIAQAAPEARDAPACDLVLAADQFVMTPRARADSDDPSDSSRARQPAGAQRSIIAGYPWFTDWGRDTMISLEGLALITGRHADAGAILRSFADHVRNGLIPNLFPEGERQGRYNTADATLWFFHAIDRYVRITGDQGLLRDLLPKLLDVADHHVRGTRFGIGVDPADGLLREGAPGHPLTWMDAQVGDWVVTPRRGKPVEINALWYNALRLLEEWVGAAQGADAAAAFAGRAEQVCASFNARFWYAEGGYLYDLVDGEEGDDNSFRPNQVFAISLPHPVLEERRWRPVMQQVQQRLLTPVGLRSLAPGHPDYRKNYFGDRRSRDAAYHQGTVWPWLIGPWADAWLRTFPEQRLALRTLLEGLALQLDEACVGSISEIYDAGSPYDPRGCVAQAWSVAELLRALTGTAAPAC